MSREQELVDVMVEKGRALEQLDQVRRKLHALSNDLSALSRLAEAAFGGLTKPRPTPSYDVRWKDGCIQSITESHDE